MANILKAIAQGAEWPLVSTMLQATGTPKAQADLQAQQMVSGQGPPTARPPTQAGMIGGQIPWMWIGLGLVGVSVIYWLFLRPPPRRRNTYRR